MTVLMRSHPNRDKETIVIDPMAVKLKVIKAACGITALSELDLLHRLEELYLEGIAEGLKLAKEQLHAESPK